MDYKLAKSQAMVGYHVWSVGHPEKPTGKLNTASSQTPFLGLAWWVETACSAPSLLGSGAWVLWPLVFVVEACLVWPLQRQGPKVMLELAESLGHALSELCKLQLCEVLSDGLSSESRAQCHSVPGVALVGLGFIDQPSCLTLSKEPLW